MRSGDAAIRIARYILENPVRAGLVEDIRAYPFAGSDTYTLEQILEAVQMPDGWMERGSTDSYGSG